MRALLVSTHLFRSMCRMCRDGLAGQAIIMGILSWESISFALLSNQWKPLAMLIQVHQASGVLCGRCCRVYVYLYIQKMASEWAVSSCLDLPDFEPSHKVTCLLSRSMLIDVP